MLDSETGVCADYTKGAKTADDGQGQQVGGNMERRWGNLFLEVFGDDKEDYTNE